MLDFQGRFYHHLRWGWRSRVASGGAGVPLAMANRIGSLIDAPCDPIPLSKLMERDRAVFWNGRTQMP